MRVASFTFSGMLILACLIIVPAAGALSPTINGSLSADTVTPGSPLTFTVSLPENTTQVQEWTLACYQVTGVMSVPASCGAEVAVKNVSAGTFVWTDLPTTTEGSYTVIAALPGPDGTFGVGYDRASRTLYYAANRTVIANWSRENPSDKEEAAVITKALDSPGIENPSVSGSYTVTTETAKTVTTTMAGNTKPAAVTNQTTVPESTSVPAQTTAAPGFGSLIALTGLILAAFAVARQKY